MQKNPKIPANYQTVMPYLIIPDASGFIIFTQKTFDAIETHRTMRDETIIMHAEIMIGECSIMFADSTEKFEPRPAGMFIYVNNADETYKKALDAGATSIQQPSDQPYGRSCGVLDAFGNTWWITSINT
jgi:PhnB protein